MNWHVLAWVHHMWWKSSRSLTQLEELMKRTKEEWIESARYEMEMALATAARKEKEGDASAAAFWLKNAESAELAWNSLRGK